MYRSANVSLSGSHSCHLSMCLKQEVASIIFDQNQCNSASADPQADVTPVTFCLYNYSPQDCLDLLLTRVQRSPGNRTSSSKWCKGLDPGPQVHKGGCPTELHSVPISCGYRSPISSVMVVLSAGA